MAFPNIKIGIIRRFPTNQRNFFIEIRHLSTNICRRQYKIHNINDQKYDNQGKKKGKSCNFFDVLLFRVRVIDY